MGGGTTSGVKNDAFLSCHEYLLVLQNSETVWRAGHTYNTLFNWECANWYAPFDVPGMHYHFRTNRHGSSECISIPHGLHGPANHRYSSAFSQKVRLWQGSGHAVVLCFHVFLIWFCSMLNVFKYIMIHSSLLFMQDRFVEMPTLWFHRYDFDSDTIWNGDGIQIWESLPLQFLYFQDLRSTMMEGPLSIFLQPQPVGLSENDGKAGWEHHFFSVK